MTSVKSIHLTVRSKNQGRAALRRMIDFTEIFARDHDLASAERARLLIILEELFTNTVNHGYIDDASRGTIEIALAADVGRLRIAYSDDGRPFDPLGHPLTDLRSQTNQPIGGLGLYIVRSLVDEVRYRRDGDRNRLELVRWIGAR